MVDELSGSNERIEVARRIAAASGDRSTTAIIASPARVSIGETFAQLETLRVELLSLDSRITLRSIDEADDQLFVYDLSRDRPIVDLLGVLRHNEQARTIINRDATRFLIVVTAPESLELGVLRVLDDFAWGHTHVHTVVLANSLLERDVVAGLGKDLRLLLPAIVGITLVALFLAFGTWRALLLPLFASVASTVVTFALFSAAAVTINLITLLALPVVLIVGLANSCHFLAKSGADVASRHDVDAIVRLTLQRVGPPFFFSTLTTAIALVSLGFNDIPQIANLGLLSAAALLLVFLLVLLAAPLALRWYLAGPRRSWQESRLFGRLSRSLAEWRVHVSTILLLAMLAGALSVPLLTVKS